MGCRATCASFRACGPRDCDVDWVDDDDDSSTSSVGARDVAGDEDRAEALRSLDNTLRSVLISRRDRPN